MPFREYGVEERPLDPAEVAHSPSSFLCGAYHLSSHVTCGVLLLSLPVARCIDKAVSNRGLEMVGMCDFHCQ